MIIEKNTVQVEHFGGQPSHAMSIDKNSLVHIMTVLGNLYSNPILAVVREYSTNAMDSHIAAGKPNTPIRVQLPSHVHPVFMVSDEGTGLTEEEVYSIYGSYGASTKRESNDFNGQLGFGCKSAFSYTDQFTVKSTKNGVTKVFLFSLDENGAGEITKMGEQFTDTADGVSVSVPVKTKDIQNFITVANEFYSVWEVFPQGLEKGTTPAFPDTCELENGASISFDRYTFGYNYAPIIKVVMGNVTYSVDYHALRRMDSNFPFNKACPTPIVLRVPIGTVQFTPSREELKLNTNLVNLVRQALDMSEKYVVNSVGKEFAALSTYREKYALFAARPSYYKAAFQYMATVDSVFYKRKLIGQAAFSEQSLYHVFSGSREGSVKLEWSRVSYNEKVVFMKLPGFLPGDSWVSARLSAKLLGISTKEMAALRTYVSRTDSTVVIIRDDSELPKNITELGYPTLTVDDLKPYFPAPQTKTTPPRPRGLGLYRYYGPAKGVTNSLLKVEDTDLPASGSKIVLLELDGNHPATRKLNSLDANTFQCILEEYASSTPMTVYAARGGNIRRIEQTYTVVRLEDALQEYLEAYIVNHPKEFEATQYNYNPGHLGWVRQLTKVLPNPQNIQDLNLRDVVVKAKDFYVTHNALLRTRNIPHHLKVLVALKGDAYHNALVESSKKLSDSLLVPGLEEVLSQYPLLIPLSSLDVKIKDVEDYVNALKGAQK